MFRGINQVTMDQKGRFSLPTRQRERLQQCCEGQVFVTIHSRNPCLVVYPMTLWESYEAKLLNMDRRDPSVNAALRMLTAYGQEYELDDVGRIVLNQILREKASLKKSLMLVGAIDRLEIWDEDLFNKDSNQQLDVLSDINEVDDAILHLGV